MKEFFENLKEIRQSKGMSLKDIADRSRLSLKYLQDIENGDLENLPQGYDRIFFKRYLKEIDEDKDEVWQDFNLFFGSSYLEENLPYSSNIPQKENAEHTEEDEKSGGEHKKSSFLQEVSLRFNMDKLHRYFWIAVTVIVLGIVGYFAYQQFVFVRNSQFQIKEVTVQDFIEEMQKQDSLSTPELKQSTIAGSDSSGSLNVELHAVQRTWIREIRDRQDTTDYILPSGIIRRISAGSSVQLILGRANGVEVWLNGRNLGIMGEADEVVLGLLLTHEGIAQKRLKKVSQKQKVETDTTSSASQNNVENDTARARNRGEGL